MALICSDILILILVLFIIHVASLFFGDQVVHEKLFISSIVTIKMPSCWAWPQISYAPKAQQNTPDNACSQRPSQRCIINALKQQCALAHMTTTITLQSKTRNPCRKTCTFPVLDSGKMLADQTLGVFELYHRDTLLFVHAWNIVVENACFYRRKLQRSKKILHAAISDTRLNR